MSRSQPNEHAPNPAVRFFEWNGEHGTVRFYDKELKENITVPLPFQFLLLDQLGSVRGWHDASESGIYSNEVRDTRQDVLIVKAFKGGTLAEGLYKDIKDRAHTVGGQFVTNCYIAFKKHDTLQIGSLRLKGAALNAWVEFGKQHRRELFEQAIVISGYTEGKKGRIVYRVPTFGLNAVLPQTQDQAIQLDKAFQSWLDDYLKRTTREQMDVPADTGDSFPDGTQGETLTADEIPF